MNDRILIQNFIGKLFSTNKEKAKKKKNIIGSLRQYNNRIDKQKRNDKKNLQRKKTSHLQNFPYITKFGLSAYVKCRMKIDELVDELIEENKK